MLDLKHPYKIKNDKILRWLLELTAFDIYLQTWQTELRA